ncbi:MAG: hypothetical protein LBC80_02740 [Treponema sp.]|jgi:uncharacterized Zn finger protein (UPF0148 family)|nr:hypothetical protein [Treponema sp.]
MSDEREKTESNQGGMKRCPACRQPLSDSFQTKCPTCGHELNTAEAGQSVKEFFQKLDEVTQKEYEADRQREGRDKKKKKQPKIVVLCEIFAILSVILIVLHLTGLNRMLRETPLELLGIEFSTSDEIPTITIQNNTGYEILHVYISPSANDQWGYNWLPPDVVLNNNEYTAFTLHYPLNVHTRYDIRLQDIDGDSYTKRNINVSRERQIIFVFSDIHN